MQIEYRSIMGLQIRSDAGESGGLRGYASIKNEEDSYGDIIRDGAYVNLEEFVSRGFVPYGHDWAGAPVGYVTSAVEDDKGLIVEIEFHSTPEAQSARQVVAERLAAGKSVGLSIGFYVKGYSYEGEGDERKRIVTALNLVEVSIVNAPAAPNALVTDVRGAGRPLVSQLEALQANAQDLAQRVGELVELRRMDGRTLGEERVSQLATSADALESLVVSIRSLIQPVRVLATDDEVAQYLAATQTLQQHANAYTD